MYQLAKRNGIPDVTVSKKFPWTREAFYIFGSTLHLPMLNQCLVQYKQLQKALATYVWMPPWIIAVTLTEHFL